MGNNFTDQLNRTRKNSLKTLHFRKFFEIVKQTVFNFFSSISKYAFSIKCRFGFRIPAKKKDA